MIDLFWSVATSYLALSIIGIVLLAALIVGYFPLAKYLPVIGPYIEAAKLIAFLLFGLLAFLVGHRLADESAEAKSLRAQLAAKTIDLSAANKAAEQADAARAELQAKAEDSERQIKEYEDALKKRPNAACLLTPGDFSDGVRH